MASGGRSFPSATSGGLTRAGEAIFDALLARKQLALQGRQLDIADRAGKINQFVSLVNLLPPGSVLGDLGQVGMDRFSEAFDIPSEGLEGLELNPETIDTVLNTRGAKMLQENPELLLPSIRSRVDLEPDQDIADLRTLQAQMQFDALTEITNDPQLRSEFVSRALGREPITVTIPGAGGAPDRSVSFDSPTAANIYAQFLLGRERFSFELDLQNEEASDGLIKEIQAAVNKAGFSVASNVLKDRVLPLYNQAVQSGDIEVITRFLSSASEGEALAMQFLLGSIKAGEETFLDQLRQSAPQLANFLEIGDAVRKVLGPEEAAQVLPGITEALGGMAGTLRDPLFGGLQFEFSGVAPTDRGTTLPAFGNVPRDVLITAAKNLFDNGEQTREELVASLGEDVVSAALGTAESKPPATPRQRAKPEPEPIPTGGFDPAEVPGPVQSKARQLNILLQRQGRAREAGTTIRGVTQAIERLQREIRAGIALPDAGVALQAITLSEAQGDIPAGGINPTSVPAFARADVSRLNALLRRRVNATGRVARDLDGQIGVIRRKIQKAIAER